MARNRDRSSREMLDEFEGVRADEGGGESPMVSAADLLSQYFGTESPAVEAVSEPVAPVQDYQSALAAAYAPAFARQQEELRRQAELAQQAELLRQAEAERAAEEARQSEARRMLEEQQRIDAERQVAQTPIATAANISPSMLGTPSQADLDAIAAQFIQAGYTPSPAINFTGDPNQPFFDMRTPEGGVDPRYFVEGLTSPAINTVRTEERGSPTRGEPDRQCPPNMEFDYELGRCVRKEVIEPPAPTAPPATPPPTTAPPATTPPPTTAPPATPPPTTAPPVTTAPPATTRPPPSCPPGYIYNPETRQCEAFLTSPAPTPPPTTPRPTAPVYTLPTSPTPPPPTSPPPLTTPPPTPPPSPTPPPTPPPCPPGYERNAAGQCAPIDLGPCQPGYVRSTITGKCEPVTTGAPSTTPPPTTAPPATTTPVPTTPPPTSGCKQGEVYSTTLGRCVPITTGAPAATPPPATTKPPPGVITKFDPSAALLAAYRRMFGGAAGKVDLGVPTGTGGGGTDRGTSAIVPTPGGPAGTRPPSSPIPLPGFPSVSFTPGQPQFFNTPQTTGGLLPGTLPTSYNPLAAYKGPLASDLIRQNPNLNPAILGGLEGLGYFTDRLGNRILSPGGGFMSFAEGGEAKKEDEEDTFDPSSKSAQAALRELLSAAPEQTQTQVAISPNARAVRKTKKKAVDTGKAKGISMSLEESMATTEPVSKGSAREQLAALGEEYKSALRAIGQRERGLMAETFNAPTLERASLAARGPLTTRRFQDGGEVDDSTPLQRRIYMESVSDPTKRTAPITEKSLSAKELDKLRKLIDIAERNPALSEKTGKPLPGVVDYAHQRMLMEQVDPMGSLPISMRDSDYNALESGNLRNTLGQFTFERLPDGTLVVKDTYDYTGDVGERFNPLIRYANKKGVNRPVKITLPPKAKKEK